MSSRLAHRVIWRPVGLTARTPHHSLWLRLVTSTPTAQRRAHHRGPQAPQAYALYRSHDTASWSVEDMLAALENARLADPQYQPASPTPQQQQQQQVPGQQQQQHKRGQQGPTVATAVQLAKETLMAVGYNMPMRSRDRDSFVERGGLGLVMRLLPHPELQYFAMSALVVLLSSPGSSVYEHPELASDILKQALQDGLLDSLLPLLRPGQAWVIQGRCCGVLANLLRLQQRTEAALSSIATLPDAPQNGVQWKVLRSGGVPLLTALLADGNAEVANQAGAAISRLTGFADGGFREALVLETPLVSALVAYLDGSASHVQYHAAAALIALAGADSGACRKQAVSAGVVGALMQMQSISYCGAFRQPAAELLRSLAVQDSAARQQMLSAVVRQPPETTPAEWARWWAELQQDLGLCTPSIDNVQSEMSL